MLNKKILYLLLVCLLLAPLSFADGENTYKNEGYGITISGPKGWKKEVIEGNPMRGLYYGLTKEERDDLIDEHFKLFLQTNPSLEVDKNLESKIKKNIKRGLTVISLVTFSSGFAEDNSAAVIGVGVVDIPEMEEEKVTTMLDYIKDNILLVEVIPKNKQLIESPIEIDVNGKKMVRMVTLDYDEYAKYYVKNISYALIKNKKLYMVGCSITYYDQEKPVADYQNAFDNTVNSLVIEEARDVF